MRQNSLWSWWFLWDVSLLPQSTALYYCIWDLTTTGETCCVLHGWDANFNFPFIPNYQTYQSIFSKEQLRKTSSDRFRTAQDCNFSSSRGSWCSSPHLFLNENKERFQLKLMSESRGTVLLKEKTYTIFHFHKQNSLSLLLNRFSAFTLLTNLKHLKLKRIDLLTKEWGNLHKNITHFQKSECWLGFIYIFKLFNNWDAAIIKCT